MKRRKPKTYEAEYQGRKACLPKPRRRQVPVTVPERHDTVAYSSDAAEVLRDVLRDTLSPQAVAATANALRVQVNRGIEDKHVRQQLRWFADRLVAMVGGVYAAKVSGAVVPVRIDAENPHGGWNATNTATGKRVRIKSAQRLRGPWPSKTKAATKTKAGDQTEPKPGEIGLEVMRRRHAAKAAAATTAAAEKAPTAAPVAKKPSKATKETKKRPGRDTGERRGTSGRKKAVPKAQAVNAAMQAVGRAKKERASAINLAAKVLADAKEPLSCGEMMKRILDRKLWTTKGKTPAATLYPAILREIQAKGPQARFRKVERGKFALAV